MNEYPCRVDKCPGTVSFPQRDATTSESSSDEQAFVILDEPLAQCNVCNKAYFKSELAK